MSSHKTAPPYIKSVSTAILVDGGFYRKRAAYYIGPATPEERAKELMAHCYTLLRWDKHEQRNLYRIFYYDCPPIDRTVFHPLLNKSINLGKTDEYKWMNAFLAELKHQRKLALRLGRISQNKTGYNLKYETLKKLMNRTITIDDLTESDFCFTLEQKGVDMRIGIDISSLAFNKNVDQIILISGDSDFVPAAKQARREGIDFLLNNMGATIKDDLFEHIDGLIQYHPKEKNNPDDNMEQQEPALSEV